MATIKSKPGLLNHFNAAPEEIRAYFVHVPKLVDEFPLDVCLSYVFAQLERAQNNILYCGVVKLHRAHGDLAWDAISVHHMTRAEFRAKFDVVFGQSIPGATSGLNRPGFSGDLVA